MWRKVVLLVEGEGKKGLPTQSPAAVGTRVHELAVCDP